jgi:disease resistance protein RPM1
MFEIEGHSILSRLREFTLLRVLDLEGCKGLENKHVKHICGMYLLRFLSLRSTEVSVLPKKIGELEHLQMLNVDWTCIEELPEELTKLEKLEHVDFRNKHDWSIMWTPPQGLSKMKALREVNYIIVNDVHVAKEVGELGQLRQIGIWVSHENQEVLPELACSLSKRYSLRSLSIGCFEQGPVNFLLQMESPPRLLRHLYIDGDINELPNWVGSLAYLIDIDIMNTCLVGDQLFGVLCKLPNLQKIWLGPRGYIGHELVARTAHNFPMLRNLVCHCTSMHPTLQFENGSMDKLEGLSVEFGADGRSLVGIQHLPNLKEVELIGVKDNSTLSNSLDQLIAESKTRKEHNQFKVVAKYQ